MDGWTMLQVSTEQSGFFLLDNYFLFSIGFNYLGPLMAQKLDAFVCALDFPGHGESDHLSSTFYSTIGAAATCIDFMPSIKPFPP